MKINTKKRYFIQLSLASLVFTGSCWAADLILPAGDDLIVEGGGVHITGGAEIVGSGFPTSENVLNELAGSITIGNFNYFLNANPNTSFGVGGVAIGTGNIAQQDVVIGNSYMLILGYNNFCSSKGSLISGTNNGVFKFDGYSTSNLVGGDNNTVSGARQSLVYGFANTVDSVKEGGVEDQAHYSVLLGVNNNLNSQMGYAIGGYNEINGVGSSALGYGLTVDSFLGVYVGSYNEPIDSGKYTWGADDPVFVKRNGDIIIAKPQGDISMGIFE